MLQSVSLENEGAYLCTAANALGKAVSTSVLHLLGECPVLLVPDGSFIRKTQGQDLWTLESKVNDTGVSWFSPPATAAYFKSLLTPRHTSPQKVVTVRLLFFSSSMPFSARIKTLHVLLL